MKALIIINDAKESDNSVKVISKPLTQLLGLPLIERIILASKSAGINSFIIITDCPGKEIRSKLGDGSKYGVEIYYVEDRE